MNLLFSFINIANDPHTDYVCSNSHHNVPLQSTNKHFIFPFFLFLFDVETHYIALAGLKIPV